MSETDKEIQAALIGVDPEDRDEVAIGGARFTIKPISAAQWDSITTQRLVVYQMALRRAIAKCRAEEIVADEKPEGSDSTNAERMAFLDPQTVAEISKAMLEAIKYGVISFTGWNNRKGESFPCESADGALSERTMSIFAINPLVTHILWGRLQGMNDLGTLTKKA